MTICTGIILIKLVAMFAYYLISALASPPRFDAKQRYTPLSSKVTASIDRTEPSNLVLGPDRTNIGSAPVWAYQL